MNIKTLGIDLAKNIFQLNGIDADGNVVLQKRISRHKLSEFMANLPSCLVGMESCGGSNYWARKFINMGHDVKLMAPQFVKPYVKSNKSDLNDAEAICEAVTRPNMRFVGLKTIENQDIQCLHRIRNLIIKNRTALVNQIRGLLTEYGIVVAQGVAKLRKELPYILENGENDLSTLGRGLFSNLLGDLKETDRKVKHYDALIKQLCKSDIKYLRLTNVLGVGSLTATALVSSIGDARVFKNGRELAAAIGLVPRQFSSGGKQTLLGISKRGSRYLRYLLIHGARAAIYKAKSMSDKQSKWIKELIERRGMNRATVALANKNARILWAMMVYEDKFQTN